MSSAVFAAEPPAPNAEGISPSAAREQRLRRLAAEPLTPAAARRTLLDRLREPAQTIELAYARLASQPPSSSKTSQAAEWLLDNYRIVRRAVRGLDEEFPAGFERKLRIIAEGPQRGVPLAYVLAQEIVEARACRLDIDSIAQVVAQFQEQRSLSIAEVWALPALLRLALLEQLAVAVAAIGHLDTAERGPGAGADQARLVGTCIRSLQLLETADWKGFFESVSATERILREDPTGVYHGMDFNTRDRYRKAVEELAAAAPRVEEEAVAAAAVALAAQVPAGRGRHVGHYLVDAGRSVLEQRIGCRLPWRARSRRWLMRHPGTAYFGSVAIFTAFLLALVLGAVAASGGGVAAGFLTLLLALVPVQTVAVTLVNHLVTRVLPPCVLPKMDFSRGIPPEYRTLVAVPVLLSDAEEIDALLASLEIRFLANTDPNVPFALLSDLRDAPSAETSADAALVERAAAGIAALNERYGTGGDAGPFHLLHRARRWSPSEQVWMGWERKRGKLGQLNQWLLGGDDPFVLHVGNPGLPGGIAFVLVLDADTDLPRDAVRELAATLAHPLNRAEFAPGPSRVVAGYTVLQPRIEVSPIGSDASWFAAIFSPAIGLDPYTHAVSDVYQDLFGEGIFVGKGLIDIAAFERSLQGVIPEEALLSHDLFEGIHGRVGLVTDAVLFEDYPSSYLAHMRRVERWVRGDWQLVPWLFRRVPLADGKRGRSRLDLLGRWKILDNLRRSLLAATLLLSLVSAWLFLPNAAAFSTFLLLAVPAVPLLVGSVARASGAVRSLIRRDTEASDPPPLRPAVGAWLCGIAFLPHQAAVESAAIARTLVRVLWTRRHMLQWTTAAHTAQLLAGESSHARFWREMAAGPACAAATGALLVLGRPESLATAAPLLALWLAAPELARLLSRPRGQRRPALTPASEQSLRVLQRRTWSFFETFVGPNDQWLPPDSVAEEPRAAVAHRTSPTNIGLLQVATIAAVDRGYVGLLPAVLQLKNTFDSLDRMERYRGHLLNWYGTQDLAALEPRYVSTVDNGNFVASLIVVKQACLAFLGSPVVGAERREGFLDTLAVLRDLVEAKHAEPLRTLLPALDDIERAVRAWPSDPRAWHRCLAELRGELCPALDRQILELLHPGRGVRDPAVLADLRYWAAALNEHADRMQRQLELFLPWAADVQPPVDLFTDAPSGVPAALEELRSALSSVPTVVALPAVAAEARARLAKLLEVLAAARVPSTTLERAQAWGGRLDTDLATASQTAQYLADRLRDTADRADAWVRGTDFSFLYDPKRRLLRLGYNVSAGRMDETHYDLLASEARLASFVAIAKGDIPEEDWLHLGRPIGYVAGRRTLLSWGGTMFEYLMPPLLLREAETTLMGRSNRAALNAQIRYARERGVPWGISESGYYHFDAQQTYQYRAFGVPGLGFKRGLDEDLVVAPYACVLAAPLAPQEVAQNLEQLRALGLCGRHGYFEAIDFTPARRRNDGTAPVVREYMAHHQGMIMAALDNALGGDSLVGRFHADPLVKTAELLLYERPPGRVPIERPRPGSARPARARQRVSLHPWIAPPPATAPSAHVLSNGRYSIIATGRGDGMSRWGRLALTRWSPDPTFDGVGFRLYVRDRSSGRAWCAFRDAGSEPPQTLFSAHLIERQGRRDGLTLRERLTVVPEADVEIRHFTVGNDSGQRRQLTLVGYGEVVLGDPVADRRHPAFSKLFVESEYVAADHALVFHRRPRTAGERQLYLAHGMSLPRSGARPAGHDGARETFLGRGGSLGAPAALAKGDLAGRTGTTLDPVMVLAAHLDVPPHRAREVAFVTAVADSRAGALELLRRYRTLAEMEWTIDLARHRAATELAALELDPDILPQLAELLGRLVYSPGLHAAPDLLERNTAGRSTLWKYAISGDLPILLVRVRDATRVALPELLLRGQGFWRGRGIDVDLVLLNELPSTYDAAVDDAIARAVAAASAQRWMHQPGGVFVVRGDQIPETDRIALLAAARVVLDGAAETITEQLAAMPHRSAELPPLILTGTDAEVSQPLRRPADLELDNGIGGFSPNGDEYVIHLEPGATTPAPWANVVANASAGFLVSEAGSGYTWVGNSGENRLTPWRNDPVTDEPGEAIYLRDEESGAVWSPTPLPAPGPGAYQIRHGVGYSVFRHRCRGISQELRLFLAGDDPVKIVQLRLDNDSGRVRRLTVTYCVEWVLSATREIAHPFAVTAFDTETQTLLARNPWNDSFGAAVAFVAAGSRLHGFTADRGEFFGHPGDRARPAALGRIGLASVVRPDVDPCGALQVHVDLQPGESRTVHYLLGQSRSRAEALTLARAYRYPAAVDAAWAATQTRWQGVIGARSARTPDRALDFMLNRWLPYQTLSARVLGRTGFYQSSGAFGFRDQLQDVAALLPLAPALCRDHLLECAARQFEEGDVLHWWHPPSGAGLRSRCSDDLLWLPFVTADYVAATGDADILAATAPFLAGEPLREGELERYGHFEHGNRSGSLYEHCLAAIDRGFALGRRGLPLFGTGDWNDAMNRVGAAGRGESVWLAWFLHATLVRFAPLCRERDDPERAADLLRRAEALRAAIEGHAWDGRWYRRGYYDDGQPLGSARRDACQIDSIVQSWAVLAGAGEAERARRAMQAVYERLVREKDGLILLFTPPFDSSDQDPGYIKAYPPGVRENGGQYTHAAIWSIWAFAALGQIDLASRLFRMILPTTATRTSRDVARYRVEPYVIAADVYGAPPHVGRGGWTWYTGSAGWAYRFGWEMLLGLRLENGALRIDPHIPSTWPGFQVVWRDGETTYEIHVENPDGVNHGVVRIELDGKRLSEPLVPQMSDGRIHRVVAILGERLEDDRNRERAQYVSP